MEAPLLPARRAAATAGCGKLGAVAFAIILVLSILPAYILSLIGLLLQKCVPGAMKEAYRTRMNDVVTCTCVWGFRLTLTLCCWIRIAPEGLADYRGAPMGRSGRPCVIVSNHTSFLDIIVLSAYLPCRMIPKIRTIASNHIFNMPALGRIQYGAGTVKVSYRSHDSFEVDRSAIAGQLLEVEAYLRSGNWVTYFPEGTINGGDARKLQTFRAGGFQPFVHVDSEIWCVAHQGFSESWPKASMLGGYPARVGMVTTCLCESSHRFLADAGLPADADDRAKALHLATCAQAQVQKDVNAAAQF